MSSQSRTEDFWKKKTHQNYQIDLAVGIQQGPVSYTAEMNFKRIHKDLEAIDEKNSAQTTLHNYTKS